MNNIELKDFIYHKSVIPKEVCKDIIDSTNTSPWETHAWYNADEDSQMSHDNKELDVLFPDREVTEKLFNYVVSSFQDYGDFCYNLTGGDDTFAFSGLMSKCCPPRLNRYPTGTMMRPHFDHIHNLFDGQNKGIPVLSLIGVLNDDYTGGELTFFEDYNIETKAGDVIIFPSCFLYPHGVQEVTQGNRYSFVSWGW